MKKPSRNYPKKKEAHLPLTFFYFFDNFMVLPDCNRKLDMILKKSLVWNSLFGLQPQRKPSVVRSVLFQIFLFQNFVYYFLIFFIHFQIVIKFTSANYCNLKFCPIINIDFDITKNFTFLFKTLKLM